jgi:predicted N-acetyltransferase YhbS
MPDGPRALRPDEWSQLNELVSAVFRPEMFHDYPQLFNEQNRQNLRVVAEDGKVVTHVGMTERAATLAGCRIDVACIGAVSTYEAYRGRGFASQAFQDCCDKAAADGIDIMLISGGRGLYTRVGCRQVGQDWDFAFDTDTVRALQPRGAGYRIVPVGAGAIPVLRSLYQREPVRFLRRREDWEMAFACGVVMNVAADFWGVTYEGAGATAATEGEGLVAYAIVHQPDKVRRRSAADPRLVRVVEFAGDRAAVAAALPQLLDHYGAQRVTIHVQGGDLALHRLLSQAGVAGAPAGASGTLRVINFRQLMDRCRPLLAERIGDGAAGELRFESDERPGSALGGFTIRSGGEYLRVPDLGALACYLFGSPRREPAPVEGSPRIASLLAGALPLPALWYGMNYV